MKRDRVTIAAALAVAIALGCGEDETSTIAPGPPALDFSELVGTWEATELRVVNLADLSETVDLLALGGAATIKIESNRDATFVGAFEGEIEAGTGRLTIAGQNLYVKGDGQQESQTFACALSGDTMTLTDDHESYDFDGDGVEDESARLIIVLEPGVEKLAIDDVVGSWTATSWEFTNDSDPSEKVDVIPLGASGHATISSAARYTLAVTDLDGVTETNLGALRSVGDYLVALNDDDLTHPDAFSWSLVQDIMTLEATDVAYDFDDDGLDEEASLRIVWERS